MVSLFVCFNSAICETLLWRSEFWPSYAAQLNARDDIVIIILFLSLVFDHLTRVCVVSRSESPKNKSGFELMLNLTPDQGHDAR